MGAFGSANLLILLAQFGFFYYLYHTFKEEEPNFMHEFTWLCLLGGNLLTFLISGMLFLCVNCKDPGYS